MGRRKTISTDAILDAAEAIVTEEGVHRLSLNAVAARAGISKGGLTYSFPTREALLRALTERDFQLYSQDLDQAQANLPAPSGDPLRDRLQAGIEVMRKDDESILSKSATMNVSLAQTVSERDLLRDYYRRTFATYAEVGHDRSRVLILALEAMFLLRGLGFADWSETEWSGLLDDIQRVCLPETSAETACEAAPGGSQSGNDTKSS